MEVNYLHFRSHSSSPRKILETSSSPSRGDNVEKKVEERFWTNAFSLELQLFCFARFVDAGRISTEGSLNSCGSKSGKRWHQYTLSHCKICWLNMFDNQLTVHQQIFWNYRVCPGCFSQIKWRWTPQRKSHRQTHLLLLLLLSSQCNRPPNPLPILNHPLQRHQPTNPTSSLSTRFPLLPPMWTSLTKLWTECHKVKCQKRTELLRVNLFLELHKPKALFRIEKRQISFMKRFGPTSKVFPLNLSEVI